MLYFKADVSKPLSYISCGQFMTNGNWIHAKRKIDSFEIIYGIKGCAYIQQDNEKFEITPNTILLLMPGHIHKGFKMSLKEVSFFWMHFKCPDTYSILTEKVLPLTSEAYVNMRKFVVIPTFFKSNECEKLTILIKQLLHYAYSKNCMTLINNYCATLILLELSQQAISSDPMISHNNKNRKVSEIVEWLRINADKNYLIAEIAKKFNFNRDYFCRIFKEQTGMSVVKYINSIKIAKAKEMLYSTELSIKEIAYKLGFNDDKYFMKLFKAYEGLTPTEYRSTYYIVHLNNK